LRERLLNDTIVPVPPVVQDVVDGIKSLTDPDAIRAGIPAIREYLTTSDARGLIFCGTVESAIEIKALACDLRLPIIGLSPIMINMDEVEDAQGVVTTTVLDSVEMPIQWFSGAER
jgi:hypothetical protein